MGNAKFVIRMDREERQLLQALVRSGGRAATLTFTLLVLRIEGSLSLEHAGLRP